MNWEKIIYDLMKRYIHFQQIRANSFTRSKIFPHPAVDLFLWSPFFCLFLVGYLGDNRFTGGISKHQGNQEKEGEGRCCHFNLKIWNYVSILFWEIESEIMAYSGHRLKHPGVPDPAGLRDHFHPVRTWWGDTWLATFQLKVSTYPSWQKTKTLSL